MEETNYDSFELLYLYVENIRCFESQEFVFTTEYNIKYDKDTRELNIGERHDKDYLKGFFGPNISNINLIVGKNGSGKSTVLELLGDSQLDRWNNNKLNKKSKWFILYKTNSNNFLIEACNVDFIKFKDKESNNCKKLYFLNPNEYSPTFPIAFLFNLNLKTNKIKNITLYDNLSQKDTHIFFNKEKTKSPFNKISTISDDEKLTYILKRKYINSSYFSELYYLFLHNKDFIFDKKLNNLKLKIDINYIETKNYKDQKLNNLINNIIDIHNSKIYANIKEEITNHILLKIIIDILYKFNLTESNIALKVNKILSRTNVNSNNISEYLTDSFKLFNGLLQFEFDISNKHLTQITDIISHIKKIPDDYIDITSMKDRGYYINHHFKYVEKIYSISIPLYGEPNENWFNLIKTYDKFDINYDYNEHYVNFKELFPIYLNRNISVGELYLLKYYAGIYYILNNCTNTQKSILIILDEPDQSLHPDWISKLINDLVKLISSLKNNKIQYQFLISTHSPFMLSDIPKEYITTIDIQEDELGNHIRIVDKSKQSFASNYYDIIKDSFFLDNTMGDFALDKIRNIHEILYDSLSQIKDNKLTTKQQVLDRLTKKVYITSEDNLLKIIDTIGEPLIRIQLHNLWNELNKQWSNNTSTFVKTLTHEEKEKLYNELKKDLNK